MSGYKVLPLSIGHALLAHTVHNTKLSLVGLKTVRMRKIADKLVGDNFFKFFREGIVLSHKGCVTLGKLCQSSKFFSQYSLGRIANGNILGYLTGEGAYAYAHWLWNNGFADVSAKKDLTDIKVEFSRKGKLLIGIIAETGILPRSIGKVYNCFLHCTICMQDVAKYMYSVDSRERTIAERRSEELQKFAFTEEESSEVRRFVIDRAPEDWLVAKLRGEE